MMIYITIIVKMQLRNLEKYKERKYSFVNQVLSVEKVTFSPAVFQPTPTLDT